jgi:hypothetical protein
VIKRRKEIMEFIKEQTVNKLDRYLRFFIPVSKGTIGKPGDVFYIYQDEKNGRYIMQLVTSRPDPRIVMPRDTQ